MRVCEGQEQEQKKLTWPDLEAGEVFKWAGDNTTSPTMMMRTRSGYIYITGAHVGYGYTGEQKAPITHYPNACIKLGEPAE